MAKLVVVLHSSEVEPRRTRALLRWAQILVPAAVIVASTGETTGEVRDGAIRIDAAEIPSGPLSLASALARAAGPGRTREPTGLGARATAAR